LPVTDVERWVRDPYALYAKKILGLKKLDAIDEELGAADRGSAIHVALELFVRDFPVALPDDKVAMRVLLELGRASFGEMLERPGVSAFWWPRYERVARWFLQWEKERRLNVVRVLSEQIGTVTFDAPAGPFILTAKADRIEVLPGGAIVVADYKTGSVPTNKQVALGFSSQLTLEGAIALAGGFPGIDAMSVDALMFVSLKGDAKAGEERCVSFGDMTTGEAVASAYERFQKFVAEFDSVEMPYLSKPHVLFEAVPSDYDHLARVKEWSSESDE
jgi:ATP-dependent helicase/nuclease subunit B